MPPLVLPRRRLLQGLVAAPFLGLGTARAAAISDVDLAIVGAGAAGLAAAHRAREKGLTARVLEARSRVGGRVHTDASLGPAFDAGAFYIHFAERNPWKGIAEALDEPLIDDNTLWGGFDVFRNGRPLPMEERWARRGAFGRLSSAIDREPEGGDLSFGEAARRYAPELRDAAGNLTLLSLGEEADRVSIRDYQRLDSGEDYVVPAGYGHLLGRYAKGLDLQLGTPVEAIDLSGDGVMLTTAKGTLRARAAIVTCSVGVLQRETIRFRPGLPAATLAALEGLRMGALTKVALHLTGERFGLTPWTQYFDVGSRPTAEPGADLINFEFWPFGRDLVIAFLGGDYARELAKAGEAAAVAAVRSRLTAILGPKVDTAFRGGRLAGWSADPLALGSYSVALPGRAAAREALAEPVAGRLVFAGEASAGSGSMTAGGAALAAQKAVDDLAVRLAVPVK